MDGTVKFFVTTLLLLYSSHQDFRGARLRVEHSLFPKGDGGPPKNRGGGGLLPIGGRGGGDRFVTE